jgi:glycerol uptake facilitator-like aquaporin
MFGRNKAAALVAEFLGTGFLTLLILSVQRSQLGLQYFVAIAAGLAIAFFTFIVGRFSGSQFNPAVTIGMWTARKITTVRAILYIIVQMLGAYAALGIYTYFAKTHISQLTGHFTGRILVAEAIGTGLYAFGFTATKYQGDSQGSRSIFQGLSYTVGILVASSASIGLLNPAVAFGVRSGVWAGYLVGPIIGAIIGVNLYTILFAEPAEVVLVEETITEVVTTRPSRTASRSTSKKAVATKKRTTTRKKR